MRVQQNKYSDFSLFHLLISCWCLPLVEASLMLEYKEALAGRPYISDSWDTEQGEKDEEWFKKKKWKLLHRLRVKNSA